MPTSQTIQPRSRHKFLTPMAALIFSVFLSPTLFMNAAYGQTVTALYSFSAGSSTGNGPQDPVAQGRDGELYGTTRNGDSGSIFKVSTSRVFEELYSFGASNVGCCPVAGLTLASDGSLYGVTQIAYGNLFKITPDGSYTDLHDFKGGSDGGGPSAPPIEGSDGNLYGMTDNMDGTGSTVYRYSLSGDLSTIYQFSDAYSHSPLIQASDGFLYGTTIDGGWRGCGTVFKMSTAGILLQSAPFLCGANGYFPGPLVQASDGSFYGTTQQVEINSSKGTIFKMTPDFKISILYTFMGDTKTGVDGADPIAGLVQATDGNLYGVTAEGGSFGVGTLFTISTNGAYELLYSFGGAAGTLPEGTPMQHTNGMLYGTAYGGGANKLGTVYQVSLGLAPFIAFVQPTGKVGQTAQILGQGLTGTTSVTFNGVAATFTVPSPTFISATIPSGATTGPVVVTTPTATLTSNRNFNILQ